jgi:carbamoyltransferase
MILAIGGSDHDVNACIVHEDRVAVAIEEERLSRQKYGLGGNLLEGLSRAYCLNHLGVTLDQVDRVVVDSILAPTAVAGCRKRAEPIDHHLAHAATAWFTSGFESAAVVVVDNAGDLVEEGGRRFLQATSWYYAHGRDIERLGCVGSTNWHCGPLVGGRPYQRGDGDHSLGHFYKKVSSALGFRYPPSPSKDGYYFPEDGITMGLASFGDLRFLDAFGGLVEFLPGGQYRLPLNDGTADALLDRLLGTDPDFEVRAAVAAAAQEVLTRVLVHVLEHVIDVTGELRVCLSGGVAMNSVANGELLRRLRLTRLHVPPNPGDNGTSVGAALWAATREPARPVPSYSVYGGRSYDAQTIAAAVARLDPRIFSVTRLDGHELIGEVAERLADGQVIAWFEGGAENGRRALGHRSILADPRRAEMREHLNRRVKSRQPFRPFAPIVPEERASCFFEIEQSSPYMQIVAPVRPCWQAALAAITHVDGSARLQTVTASALPLLHRLLGEFESATGLPILLNTSFNGHGEPIVETPQDAVKAFERMPLDGLVIERLLVTRA